MKSLLGTEIEEGQLAIHLGREKTIGFFKNNTKKNLKFITVRTKFTYSNQSYELLHSKKTIKETDMFLVFDYDAEKIDFVFDEQVVLTNLGKDQIKEAKRYFIELCSTNNVKGAPDYDDIPVEEVEETIPDYLELDG